MFAILAFVCSQSVALSQSVLPAPANGEDIPYRVSDWTYYSSRGWRALSTNDLERAEISFRDAIKIATAESAKDPRLLARSYGDLAWVLHLQGRDADAKPLAEWSLLVREKAFGVDAIQILQNLYTLSAIDIGLNEIDAAIPKLERIAAICKKTHGANSTATGDANNDLADAYMVKRQYKKAKPLYQRGLAIHASKNGSERGQIIALDGLATIDLAEGRLEDAEKRQDEILELVVSDKSFDSEFTAKILDRQASIYRTTNRAEQADKTEARAKSLRATEAKAASKPPIRYAEPPATNTPGRPR
jgi:tetratricopeptide (TPR) repeat protein